MRKTSRVWQESADAFSSLAPRNPALDDADQAAHRRGGGERRARPRGELGIAGQRIGWVQQAYGLAQVALGGIAGVVVLVGGGIAVAEGRCRSAT